MVNTTYIIWIIISLIIGILAFKIIKKNIRLKVYISLFLSTLITAGSFALFFLISNTFQPIPVKIHIDSPDTGQIIANNQVQVTGTVNPVTARVTIAIRSEKDPRWWIHAIIRPEMLGKDTGRWSINGYLGTAEQGINENFHIIAIASDESWLLNLLLGRSIRPNTPTKHLSSWTLSNPIVVRRVK